MVNVLQLPDLTPQSAIFVFLDIDREIYHTPNHILLIFRYYIFKARLVKKVNVYVFKIKIKRLQETEKKVSQNNQKKNLKYNKKWRDFD